MKSRDLLLLRLILTAIVLWFSQVCVNAQTSDYWHNLLHRESLCNNINATAIHASSYAVNGSNEDYRGFVGTDTDGCKILCEFDGPGVISHIWCTYKPLVETKRLKIYVDDMSIPVIDTPIVNLFGNVEPFIPPLAMTINHSRFSDVPIPFNSRIKITMTGAYLYYEVLGETFSSDSTIESFSLTPSATYTARLDSLRDLFNNPHVPALSDQFATVFSGSDLVSADDASDVLTVNTSGICRRLLLMLDSHVQQVQESTTVQVYVDNYPLPVMSGPVSSLFGAGLGWRPYESSLTGMSGDSVYINLPLPFRSSLRVEVMNYCSESHAVAISAEVVELPQVEVPPLRLSAVYSEALPNLPWKLYAACDTGSSGNFLGMFWEMQDTPHPVLEGDVRIYINGESDPMYPGTGTEDFFNGAFFWSNEDGQPTPFQMPLHGMLRLYSGDAAAYRWLLTNPIRFDNGVRMTMEVGAYAQLQGFYRTTSWMYRRIPKWTVVDASGDECSTMGEALQIFGYGLIPGSEATELRFGGFVLDELEGSTTVNSDSVIHFTVYAPSGGDGSYELIALLGGELDTVYSDWTHKSIPQLYFTPRNADADSFVFIGDTLSVSLHGLSPGAAASITASGISLPWLNSDSLADGAGSISGYVTIPGGLPEGDWELRGSSAGFPDAVADYPLRYRDFYRLEFENLAVASWEGYKYRYHWAPDYELYGSTDPWGHDVVRLLDAVQPGDSITFRMNILESGVYRAYYFLAHNTASAIVSIFINDELDAVFDTYLPMQSGKIARTDTIPGQIRSISAGEHLVTLSVTDKNPSSTDYNIWADQLVIERYDSNPPDFSWLSLSTNDTAWINYELTWDAFDPDDDAAIELYAYRTDMDTLHLNPQPLSEDNDSSFLWNLAEVELGLYNVFSVINDGFSSIVANAPGSLYVTDSGLCRIDSLVLAISSGGNDLLLQWEDIGALFYIVYRSSELHLVHESESIIDTVETNSYLIENELVSGGMMNFYTVYAVTGEPSKHIKLNSKRQAQRIDAFNKKQRQQTETKKEVN